MVCLHQLGYRGFGSGGGHAGTVVFGKQAGLMAAAYGLGRRELRERRRA